MDRYGEGEDVAAGRPGVEVDPAVVLADDLLADGGPEARAAATAGGVLQLLEFPEELVPAPRAVLLGVTGARISSEMLRA